MEAQEDLSSSIILEPLMVRVLPEDIVPITFEIDGVAAKTETGNADRVKKINTHFFNARMAKDGTLTLLIYIISICWNNK
jgi:hypothetical protein